MRKSRRGEGEEAHEEGKERKGEEEIERRGAEELIITDWCVRGCKCGNTHTKSNVALCFF